MQIEFGVITSMNWLAVAVTAVAGYALGAVYYMALGKPWMGAAGLTPEMIEARKNENTLSYGLAALAAVVGAVMLAFIVRAADAKNPTEGLLIGLLVGIAVTAVGQIPNYAFQFRGLKLYLIDAGYPMLQMLAGGMILATWR